MLNTDSKDTGDSSISSTVENPSDQDIRFIFAQQTMTKFPEC